MRSTVLDMLDDLPEWIRFAEGDGGDSGSGDGDESDAGSEGDDDDEDEGGSDAGGEGDGEGETDVQKLTRALAAERKLRRTAERDKKRLERTKAGADEQEAKDLKTAQEELNKASERNTKLAARVLRQSVDSAISAAAKKFNFRDEDDVLRMVDRESIDVDQDEDDPSDIDIDVKSVEKAVKALAEKKKHLLKAEGDSGPSGGRFGGGKQRQDKPAREAELKTKYKV